ncbi:COPI associated protein-domain-containing protein [Syncephalis pseudoplumigaleata]|uniref:COPI associated protein-domain-containing protein n=1 Tax=Syncephalis pseudoplumigaleata TaxID=1712513 RepID=A0A4P9Z4K2_9FUNG|nr:COPI associated protein-domain-containing protein [Syncephalis pseudoplumigaleata]|eukprot:RKP27426.1 COPI associated protein-domain-containing protein [Syncephalis pseudoplumigaleata]
MARPRLDRFGLAILLSTLNILVYIVVVIAAIRNLITANFATIIINVYIITLSLCLAVNEFQTPRLVQEYFKFTCTYVGRGLVFLFLGCVVIRQEKFNIIAGIIAAAVGVFYFILSFTPGTPHLLGLFTVFRERRAYWNEQKAKKLSQQAIQEQAMARHAAHLFSSTIMAKSSARKKASLHSATEAHAAKKQKTVANTTIDDIFAGKTNALAAPADKQADKAAGDKKHASSDPCAADGAATSTVGKKAKKQKAKKAKKQRKEAPATEAAAPSPSVVVFNEPTGQQSRQEERMRKRKRVHSTAAASAIDDTFADTRGKQSSRFTDDGLPIYDAKALRIGEGGV